MVSCCPSASEHFYPQIGVLGVFAMVGLALSLLALHLGVRWARIAGTLRHF